jgi:transposase
VYDYLEDAGYYNLTPANPVQVRLIAKSKKKTDRNDARILANLLRTSMLPGSYAPPRHVREQRQITRHRASLTTLRSEVINKIHAILFRRGIINANAITSQKGILWLYSLDLPYPDRYELDNYIKIIEHMIELIKDTKERIDETAELDPRARLLTTMYGIDNYSALMITAEIGDIRRFSSVTKLISYAGLNPSVYQSGNTSRTGHISKQGNKNLRWILVQCAHVAIKGDTTLGRFYNRIKKRRGHNIAIVATAKKMLKYAHAMLINNIPYHALQIHKAT